MQMKEVLILNRFNLQLFRQFSRNSLEMFFFDHISSPVAHLPQRKCLRFPQSNTGWKDTYLCMDSNVPYHLFWARNDDDMSDKNQCLLISEPDDKQWNKMYLCNAL